MADIDESVGSEEGHQVYDYTGDINTAEEGTAHPEPKKRRKVKSKSAEATTSNTKRHAGEKDANKAIATGEDSKKQLFMRLWSPDDEVRLLEEMISSKDQGSVPDKSAFYEHVRKVLSADFSKEQVSDKIKKLKQKYERRSEHKRYSNEHAQHVYDLSKALWGSKKVKNQKAKARYKTDVAGKNIDISRFVRYDDGPISVREIEKAGLELVEGSERVELQEKWNKLKYQELELFAERMGLVTQEATKILAFLKS